MSTDIVYAVLLETLGIAGIAGLFALKLFEARQNKIFLAMVRKKCDDVLLKAMMKCAKQLPKWQSWQMPIALPHARTALRMVYSITNRVLQNKPMRLTGVAHSKGYYATERVSKYLREVSKGKERDTLLPPKTIDD